MSAITSDWAPIETDAPVARPVEIAKTRRREEEFRSALASYMAGYVADQRKRRAETGSVDGPASSGWFTMTTRFAGWMRCR